SSNGYHRAPRACAQRTGSSEQHCPRIPAHDMNPAALASVVVAVGVVAAWMLAGALSLFESGRLRLVNRILFPAAALASLVLAVAGVRAIGEPAQSLVLPLGLPGLPFHLRIDSLAGFFLF